VQSLFLIIYPCSPIGIVLLCQMPVNSKLPGPDIPFCTRWRK